MNNIKVYKVDKIDPKIDSNYILVGNQNYILNDFKDSKITYAILKNSFNLEENNVYERITSEKFQIGSKVIIFPFYDNHYSKKLDKKIIVQLPVLEILDVKNINEEIYDRIKSTLNIRNQSYNQKEKEINLDYENKINKLEEEYTKKMISLEFEKYRKLKALRKPTLDKIINELIF